ncbi:unnamed protein product [Ceratitis capitata]|uniref:(Mediterranean fruit fly) hypothetical protein n=1 Tax=Ceratitis capitata TaxID=7213 RepID=A0A811UCY2_CERCA|nr:unnamed protein product [Ceratitis capitata]
MELLLEAHQQKVLLTRLWLEMKTGNTTIIPRRKKQRLTTPKNNMHGSRVMLFIWRDQLGVFVWSCVQK